ncbi:hypothetical protein VitviT2T_013301 [Vitis vinifera]|uniref:Protein kinase domain-containing protein n=1 Tax=Vitis vinifera TaxID=29760 RepID=A0ABY9CGA5_VITVI|nr:hypothetical protein VitviT2T_013301 [Vitis vinifera]
MIYAFSTPFSCFHMKGNLSYIFGIVVEAIRNVKSVYGVKRNWQGDPCAPKKHLWDGLECSYNGYNSPRIISLDLSSSGLSGKIDSSLSNLESLQYLDLSNNSLTGEVPDFLSQLPLLKTLNLSGNEFTGSVPSLLIQRSKNGSLSLSVDGNPNLCVMASCNNKKSVVIPVIASIAVVLVLLIAFLILWGLKRRRQQRQALESKANYEEDGRLESKNLQFTYSELVNITNNFQKVLGKGGFGSVYGGYFNDGTQVAVKMLSEQSAQGFKEFRSEAQLLTKVHHRNLAPLIGYCNEGRCKGLVYSGLYMSIWLMETCENIYIYIYIWTLTNLIDTLHQF